VCAIAGHGPLRQACALSTHPCESLIAVNDSGLKAPAETALCSEEVDGGKDANRFGVGLLVAAAAALVGTSLGLKAVLAADGRAAAPQPASRTTAATAVHPPRA
jgi:hypothetical protein